MRARLSLFGRLLGVVLTLSACASSASVPSADPSTRWVLVSNIRYSAQGNEPEYVWVPEDQIPTSATTVLFGKKSAIAPPHVVPKYAPPPGNAVISRLQGGPYAAAQLSDAASPKPRPTPSPGPSPSVSPARVAAVRESTPEVTPRGYVVHVDARRIVIDLTAEQGLRVGAMVRITREKIPIVHPVTGAYLGELDEDVATAEVVEVREKFAIAEIRTLSPGAEVRVKDRVVPRLQ